PGEPGAGPDSPRYPGRPAPAAQVATGRWSTVRLATLRSGARPGQPAARTAGRRIPDRLLLDELGGLAFRPWLPPLAHAPAAAWRQRWLSWYAVRMKVLGIESSCDETAVGVVEDGKRLLSNVVASSMDLHVQYGGV